MKSFLTLFTLLLFCTNAYALNSRWGIGTGILTGSYIDDEFDSWSNYVSEAGPTGEVELIFQFEFGLFFGYKHLATNFIGYQEDSFESYEGEIYDDKTIEQTNRLTADYFGVGFAIPLRKDKIFLVPAYYKGNTKAVFSTKTTYKNDNESGSVIVKSTSEYCDQLDLFEMTLLFTPGESFYVGPYWQGFRQFDAIEDDGTTHAVSLGVFGVHLGFQF